MASLTLKNLPERLLRDLKKAAKRDRRSMTQEIIHLLDAGLQKAPSPEDIDRRVKAWRKLAGQWPSDVDFDTEVKRIMDARTSGRPVDL